MGGAVWKGARNSIWRCLRAWDVQNRAGLEASLVDGRAAVLVRDMGPDAGVGMAHVVDASRVRAFERDLEHCRLCAGATKDGSGLGIVSYSPQGLAPWRWGCEVEMTKWNDLTSPVAVGSLHNSVPALVAPSSNIILYNDIVYYWRTKFYNTWNDCLVARRF